MTAAARLQTTQRALLASVVVRALLWGATAALGVLALGLAIDWTIELPRAARQAVPIVAAIAALAAAGVALYLGRGASSREAVALWIESRVPALQYALVTLAGPPRLAASHAQPLERLVAAHSWRDVVARASWRAIWPPLALSALLAVALPMVPPPARARVITPRPGDEIAARQAAAGASALARVLVTVTPPAYSRLRAESLTDPASIRALRGSRVELRGRGKRAGSVRATIGGQRLDVRARGDSWSASFAMPAAAAALQLADSVRQRLLVLEPRTDSAPTLRLSLPARDTVYRAPAGSARLAAEALDDFGVTSSGFDYIVSSGQGESFVFRTGTIAAARHASVARAELAGTLSLQSLGLGPGDVVHVRAVARDGNTVSGPSQGVSETRTLRIARAGEYDSISIEGAPPPEADKSLISQRMLIQLAEALEQRRARLPRATVISESRRISVDQKRLRKRVGALVYSRLGGEEGMEHTHDEEEEEGEQLPRTAEELLRQAEAATSQDPSRPMDFHADETPVVAVNRPLLEAYNAMWDAARELDIGEPGAALPHMRVALAAIQRARQAERIYLRGRPPTVVVDLARVRLAGVDKGADVRRQPMAGEDPAAARRTERFVRALALLEKQPEAAIDSFTLLRVDALGDAPRFAAALEAALSALRGGEGKGGDATEALGAARRALFGAPKHGPLGAWSAW